MSILIYGFLFLLAVSTSIVSAVVGMAGGIILLSVLSVFFPFSFVIPVHGIVQLVSNLSRAVLLRTYIHRKIFIYFLLGVPFGTLLAVLTIKNLEIGNFPIFLIVLLIFYAVFKPKSMPSIKLKYWQFAPLGLVAGFLGMFVGATGPMLGVFFLRDDLNKKQIIATTASAQIVNHFLKIPAFLFLGFDFIKHVDLILAMVIGSIVGTEIGIKILDRLSERYFIVFYKTTLVIIAIYLTIKNLIPYSTF